MQPNFSIPVTLFDFRESENTLYSYAKLKIFYVGMTGDKRLFTKKFSDNLLRSLPYVPVVGYYDEEEDDFKGHHESIQNIYGIVPEDTDINYIKEDGKEYAVCDVILYTGRGDRTGEIAQKIVGKAHSLELNPSDTKYKINKDTNGKTINMEFTEGSLLGLSVLGDNEKPAFTGSEFFTENSDLMKLFASFKEQLTAFYQQNNKRGEKMSVNTDNPVIEEPVITTEPEVIVEPDLQPEVVEPEFVEVTPAIEPEVVEPEVVEPEVVEPEVTELSKQERLLQAFMKVTDEEMKDDLYKALWNEFGDYCYIVQLSTTENVLVYMDYSAELAYYRVSYTQGEEGISFGEKMAVKPRFLTEDEIQATFALEVEPLVQEVVNQEGVTEEGTIQEEVSSTQEGDIFNEEEKTKSDTETEEEKLMQSALNSSEREELENYRRIKKEILVDSFAEDLTKEFIDAVKATVNDTTFEELEIVLSKEFTRMTKLNRSGQPNQNTLVYTGSDNPAALETDEQIAARLVALYK